MGSPQSKSISSLLLDLRPYHFLGYSILLGSEVFQTFINTKICFQALPRSAFTTLQRKIFPVYFTLQGSLVAYLILTYPPYSLVSLVDSITDAALLATVGSLACLNLFRYGPKTSSAMMERIHQGMYSEHVLIIYSDDNVETRDGKRHDAADSGEKMRKLNRNFSRQHAMSIHLNLIAIVATVLYGFRLSLK
jgi:hypothetical protein